MTLGADHRQAAPTGPKVAALVANLKCQLWEAANSDQPLAHYLDETALEPISDPPSWFEDTGEPDSSRTFTLRNIFSEIEYVGQAQFTLDVTEGGSFNPSLNLNQYYRGPVGDLPATGALLSVGAQIGETAHRLISLTASVDFSRLNGLPTSNILAPTLQNFKVRAATQASIDAGAELPEWLSGPQNDAKAPNGVLLRNAHYRTFHPPDEDRARPVAPFRDPPPSIQSLANDPGPCADRPELAGDLGLKDTLATGLIAAAMTDISVFPTQGSASNINVLGVTPLAAVPVTYTFGQISTQVDFTVVEGANGGPTWSLRYAKGPGGASAGLLNYQRTVKDTLVMTFVPVCIRERNWTNSVDPPFHYVLPFVDGTPHWATYLPPCGGDNYLQQQLNAAGQAQANNQVIMLQNALSQQ